MIVTNRTPTPTNIVSLNVFYSCPFHPLQGNHWGVEMSKWQRTGVILITALIGIIWSYSFSYWQTWEPSTVNCTNNSISLFEFLLLHLFTGIGWNSQPEVLCHGSSISTHAHLCPVDPRRPQQAGTQAWSFSTLALCASFMGNAISHKRTWAR